MLVFGFGVGKQLVSGISDMVGHKVPMRAKSPQKEFLFVDRVHARTPMQKESNTTACTKPKLLSVRNNFNNNLNNNLNKTHAHMAYVKRVVSCQLRSSAVGRLV